MPEVPQQPTAGAPTDDDLLAFFPPSPSVEGPKSRSLKDGLLAWIKKQLAGREEDFYGSWQSPAAYLDAGTLDRRGVWSTASNAAGAPGVDDDMALSALADGDYTLVVSTRMRSDPDNNVWALEAAKGAADYPIGRVIYVHVPGTAARYAQMTLTAAGTLVGQGNAAYIYMPVTVDEVGDLRDDDDWNRFSEVVPPDIAVDSALITSLGALWDRMLVTLESTAAILALARKIIQGINETAALAGTWTMGGAGARRVVDAGSGTGGINWYMPTPGADADIVKIDRVIHTTTWIEFGAWRVVPSGNISKSTFSGSVTYVFDYLVVDGAKAADGTEIAITLDGADIHRGELLRQVFRAWGVTIGGKGRGGEGDLWTAAGNDTDASWTSTAAKRAKARAALNTGRLDKDIAGSGALALTAEELGYDLVRLTGAKTGDRILSVPANKPVGMLVFRNESTGAGHDAKLKVATQANGAAITLPAGDSIVIAHGGSLARY